MIRLIVSGAIGFLMLCAMTVDAHAQCRNAYYGNSGYGYNGGGVVSRSIQAVARTVRRIENVFAGRPNYYYQPACYQPQRVIVQPVYMPVRQHRPMYRHNAWW